MIIHWKMNIRHTYLTGPKNTQSVHKAHLQPIYIHVSHTYIHMLYKLNHRENTRNERASARVNERYIRYKRQNSRTDTSQNIKYRRFRVGDCLSAGQCS